MTSIYSFLDTNQKSHYDRMFNILKSYNCAFDLSRMGAGKTYTTAALIDGLNRPNLIIICPVSVINTWEKFFIKYSTIFKDRFKHRDVISYETLRGNTSKSEKVGYCTTVGNGILTSKIEYKKEKKVNVFEPTEFLKQLSQEGLVIVLDEVHRVKNQKTLTNDSVCTILECLNKNNSNNLSKGIFLTGTLFDKKEHVFSISNLLGVYTKGDKMVTKQMGNIVHNMVNKLREFISKNITYKSDLYDEIVKTQWLETKSKSGTTSATKFSEAVFFDAMVKIVIPEVSSVISVEDENDYISSEESSIPSPQRKFLNCGILLTKGNNKVLESYLTKFNDLVSFYTKTKTKVNEECDDEDKEGSFGHIIKLLESIEYEKVPEFINYTKEIVGNGKPSKIVIAFNYNVSIKRYYDYLLKEGIIPSEQIKIVTGSTPKKVRSEVFDSFQSDDPKSVRIIIANMKVISLGVSLDDQTGVFPRYSITSPSYMAIDQHQFIRRFFRKNTKSVANVFFIYSDKTDINGKPLEQKLLNNITTKSDVIKKISSAAGDDTSKTVYMSDLKILKSII